MKRCSSLLYLCSSVFICGCPVAAAPAKVQFSRQVLPILNRECIGCHQGSAAPGGFSVESAERLVAGGRHGAAVVPGKSAASTLVRYLTGELKPQMPPNKPLALDTIALIRRWIDEGARIDSMVAATPPMGVMRGAMPMATAPAAPSHGLAVHGGTGHLPAAVSQSAPVTAVAYSPDGSRIAAGGYRMVRILDAATGSVVQLLPGPSDQVLSVVWSLDGKRLAAAGGVPGVSGEICLWEVLSPGADWPAPKVLKEHADAIYSIAWRPGAMEFATASIDKTAKVWNASTGSVTRTLKDHVDAVTSVAYSPDGKWLATGSADRTAKLYLADTGAKVNSFNHGEGVTALAFSARSDLLVTACQDKQVRVWPVKTGTVENPLRAHGEGEAVQALAFSADGGSFVWGAINRKVRLWNGEVSGQKREMSDPPPDWVYSVALSPDGKTVVAGAGDGKLYFWKAEDGKLLRAVPLGPSLFGQAAGTEAKR